MKQLIHGIALCVLFTVSSAVAEETLTAQEIQDLLSGNTISGDWNGAYKQYFEAGGFTIYIPENGRTDRGRWRVNTNTNSYESLWAAGGWTAYRVTNDGNTYYWVSSDGVPRPFTVEQGKQVDW